MSALRSSSLLMVLLLIPLALGSKRDSSVENRTLIITSILSDPFLMTKWDQNAGNDRFEGYCADLAKMLSERIGFDYIIELVEDQKYGRREENGEWTGMVGELIRGEVDMAIAPLTITAERENVIDFSRPFMSVGISILIKKPAKLLPGAFSFLNPFSAETWVFIVFIYVGIGAVVLLSKRYKTFKWPIVRWIMKGVFWFFTIILVSLYMVNVPSFMTVESTYIPVASAEELASQTLVKYGTIQGGSTQQFFRLSRNPVYQKMWDFMSSTPDSFVRSTEEGVDRVRKENGQYAFLLESTMNDYINQRMPCDTMKVGPNLASKGYGVATPIGSPLRDKISLAILEMAENWELAKLEKKWWYDKGECVSEKSSAKKSFSSLKLSNMTGIFVIPILGIVVSLVLLVVGILYKKRTEGNKRQNTNLVDLTGANKI